MGSVDIFKPLSTIVRSAVNKSQQHQEKKSCECRETNPWPLGAKQECYLCAKQHSPWTNEIWTNAFRLKVFPTNRVTLALKSSSFNEANDLILIDHAQVGGNEF